MEVYNRIREIVDANLIYCLPLLILSLMIIELLLKNRFETKKALNVVRWLIIFYTAVSLIYYLIGFIISPEKFAFTNRATGPYWFAYWLMLLSATILPFSLLIKKLATKFLYVLLISIFMKIGFYFERFVIIVTSFHRDYSPEGYNSYLPGNLAFIGIFFLQGFILAIVLLTFIEIVERVKLRYQRIK